ncbi:hypothetical protein SLS55_010234 [Diplodia seriata]|uniref:Uncharacterized protein n=1 Tax=Diplodia seriata TaxID=420778 RepID=A0ABR3BXY3_9PEZI
MHFTAFFTFALLGAAAASPVLEARQKDGDLGSGGNFLTAQIYCPLYKYCKDYGITRAQCNADCCDIKTGWGRGCPGK